MSVRKRKWITRLGEPKECWVVNYTDQQGVRRLKTFGRKKDADAYHASVKVDVKAGIHTTSKTTVIQAGEKWLADAEGRLERATVKTYQEHLKYHIAPLIGGTFLRDLTVPAVRNFMDVLRAAGRSPDMVKRVVGDLGSILANAQERGLVAQNVVRSLGRHKRRQDERRQKANLKVGVDIPTLDEIRAIIAHLNGRRRPLILTAIFTGLRASELRGLVWPNVDLKKNEVHVRQRADRYGAIGRPKSVAGERTVPLPPMVANTLREWKLSLCSRPAPGRSRTTRTSSSVGSSQRRSGRALSMKTAGRNTRACTACGISMPHGASTARRMAGSACRRRWFSTGSGIRRSR
jgi:integrase